MTGPILTKGVKMKKMMFVLFAVATLGASTQAFAGNDCPTTKYDEYGRYLGTNHENSCREAYNECVNSLLSSGQCGSCSNQSYNSGLIGRCGGGGGRDCPTDLYVNGRYVRTFHENRCSDAEQECANYARSHGYFQFQCVN